MYGWVVILHCQFNVNFVNVKLLFSYFGVARNGSTHFFLYWIYYYNFVCVSREVKTLFCVDFREVTVFTVN